MSTALQPGDKVESCVIKQRLDSSFNATTYLAEFSPVEAVSRLRVELRKCKDEAEKELIRKRLTFIKKTGERMIPVFLKQYGNPAYGQKELIRNFVAYQQQIHSMINVSSASDIMCREYDSFICEEKGKRAYYQVLELFENNQPLTDILAGRTGSILKQSGGSLPFNELLIHVRRLFYALSVLHDDDHERGVKIVHADLKPDNLLLIPDFDCLARAQMHLIDFDASIIVGEPHPRYLHFKEKNPDETYHYRGTAGYVSPEHFNGEIPCGASDVFTASVIAFEMLSRDGHPFPGIHEEYRHAVRKGKIRYSEMKGFLPPAAVDALKAGLSYNRNNRPDATEMLAALQF